MVTPNLDSARVVVVSPLRNEAAKLDEMLRSLQRQTHTNWVLLASDNWSTDETKAILESAALLDRRIHVYSTPEPLHVNDSMNFALNLARQEDGGFIQILAGDDQFADDRYLVRGLRALISSKAAVAIGKVQHYQEDNFLSSNDFLCVADTSSITNLQLFAIHNYWLCNLMYGLFVKSDFYSIIESKRFAFTHNLSSDWWFSFGVISYLKIQYEPAMEYVKSRKAIAYSHEHYTPSTGSKNPRAIIMAHVTFPFSMLGDRRRCLDFWQVASFVSAAYIHLVKNIFSIK